MHALLTEHHFHVKESKLGPPPTSGFGGHFPGSHGKNNNELSPMPMFHRVWYRKTIGRRSLVVLTSETFGATQCNV